MTVHTAAPPFAHSNGSRSAKLAIVGEAWGKNERFLGSPFVGWSGLELARILHEAGIIDDAPPSTEFGLSSAMLMHWWAKQPVFLTNTFALQPSEDNKIEALCGKKAEVGGDSYPLPAFSQGKYFRQEYLCELNRLKIELETVNPNLILALGNTPNWALLGYSKITQIRGAVAYTTHCAKGLKILPAFHPAFILRDWSRRPILLADCMKAKLQMSFPEVIRPERWVLVDPTIEEVENYTDALLRRPTSIIASDIETFQGQIEMISFAPSKDDAIVVPFVDERKPDWSYWPSPELELRAWNCCKRICASHHELLYQNGMFDMQWKARMGFRILNMKHDTMLLHHSLYPELPKGLGFLGSIYTNEAAWKLMRTAKQEELKRDE